MRTITIHLEEKKAEALEAVAIRLGMSLDELIVKMLSDPIKESSSMDSNNQVKYEILPDEMYKEIVNRLLEKNQELYKRLAKR